jgi:DNA-binding NtrC family response regulator
VTDVAPEVLVRLRNHDWPGNIRELRNLIERASIIAGEGTVQLTHLPGGIHPTAAVPRRGGEPASSASDPGVLQLPVGTTVEQGERALIELTLEHTANNRTRAAEILGISQKTLFNKLKEYATNVVE